MRDRFSEKSVCKHVLKIDSSKMEQRRTASSGTLKKERGGSLSKKQYDIIVDFLKTGAKPHVKTLEAADFTGDCRMSRFCRLRSYAKRTALQGDGQLVFKSNGKKIVPREEFVSVIKRVHEGEVRGAKHLMLSATLAVLQKEYTMGRRQFGIGEELVRQVVHSCKLGSCTKRWKMVLQRKTLQNSAKTYDADFQTSAETSDPLPPASTDATDSVLLAVPVSVAMETALSVSTVNTSDVWYDYEPCPNHSSVYQLVARSTSDSGNAGTSISKEGLIPTEASTDIVHVPLKLEQHNTYVESPSKQMPVLKSYLTNTIKAKTTWSTPARCGTPGEAGNEEQGSDTVCGTLKSVPTSKPRPYICILPSTTPDSKSNPCSAMTVLCPLGSVGEVNDARQLALCPSEQTTLKIPHLTPMKIQCVTLSSCRNPAVKVTVNESETKNVTPTKTQMPSSASIKIPRSHLVMDMDGFHGNQTSGVRTTLTESALEPVPFPSIWHYFTDVSTDRNPYSRMTTVIQDAHLDLLRATVGDRNAIERLKKKLIFLECLIRKQKQFTARFLTDEDIMEYS